MDFARKQLEKYGWTDGKGLGKHENGISEALKPKLKRSVAGIGHDAAADFTEHWWTELYNKAAGNVEVEEKNGKTKKIKTKENEFEITNSTWKIKKKKKHLDDQDEQYKDHFVKKAVLTGGGSKTEIVSERESDDEVEKTRDVFKLTDEELFAACEGRTAHKGARHGLKATGKLARIAQQEQLLLSQPQYNEYSHAKKLKTSQKSVEAKNTDLNDEESTSTKKKKRKNGIIEKSEALNCDVQLLEKSEGDSVASNDNVDSPSNKIKKSNVITFDDEENTIEIKVKKKKKSKNMNSENVQDESVPVSEIDIQQEENTPKKKKKKKKTIE